jgi:hypothetical protein
LPIDDDICTDALRASVSYDVAANDHLLAITPEQLWQANSDLADME